MPVSIASKSRSLERACVKRCTCVSGEKWLIKRKPFQDWIASHTKRLKYHKSFCQTLDWIDPVLYIIKQKTQNVR